MGLTSSQIKIRSFEALAQNFFWFLGGLLHCNDQCIPRPEIGPIVPHAHIRRGCALELHKKLFDSVSFTAETAVGKSSWFPAVLVNRIFFNWQSHNFSASVHRISASANQMILAASCVRTISTNSSIFNVIFNFQVVMLYRCILSLKLALCVFCWVYPSNSIFASIVQDPSVVIFEAAVIGIPKTWRQFQSRNFTHDQHILMPWTMSPSFSKQFHVWNPEFWHR